MQEASARCYRPADLGLASDVLPFLPLLLLSISLLGLTQEEAEGRGITVVRVVAVRIAGIVDIASVSGGVERTDPPVRAPE